MNVVAHAVYEYVGMNPGKSAKSIAAGMTEFCKARGIKPESIQAYLSILKKAGLVKTLIDPIAPRAPATFCKNRKWNDELYRKAAEPKGIGPVLGKLAPTRRAISQPGLTRTLRMLIDQHGPAKVISTLQAELCVYGRRSDAWVESMTEPEAKTFASAFDSIQSTMSRVNG